MAQNMGSQLEVVLHYAQDIPSVQTFGRQDPYCIFQLGSQKFTSRHCEDGGTKPVWNETLHFSRVSPGDVLHLTLMDKNITLDSVIGTATVKLDQMMQPGMRLNVMAPVTPKKGGKLTGVVHLALTMLGGAPGQGQYPQQYPQQAGQYPQAPGQYNPQAPGQYPQQAGQAGQFPQQAGQAAGKYPAAPGQYPLATGQYNQQAGQTGYPQQQPYGAASAPAQQYSPQGQYPQQQQPLNPYGAAPAAYPLTGTAQPYPSGPAAYPQAPGGGAAMYGAPAAYGQGR